MRPTWWTLRNTLAGLGVLAVVTLAVLAWVVVLRRQVRVARERARILFSAIPHAAHVFDLQTLDFLEVNDTAVERYGYGREEFLRMKITRIRPPEEVERLKESLLEVQATKGVSLQRRHRTKQGCVIDVELTFQTIDFKGRKAALTIAQDITERKRAGAENLRLATAIEQAAEAIVVTDPTGMIQFVNPAFSQVTGYSAHEAVGQNPRFLRSGEQDQAYYEELWGTILSGQTWNGELVNRRKDGTLYFEEMTITPVRDERGIITNFIAIKQDITHRKQAAEALSASEKRYRLLFERNLAAVFRTTLDGQILNCNQAAAEMLGYDSPHLVPNLRVTDLYAFASDRESVLEKLRSEKNLTNHEMKLRRRDGSLVWAIGNLSLVEGGDGARGIIEGTLVDITERKKAEEALRQNERTFRLLFSDNPLPMWVYEIETLRFLEVNGTAVSRYGYSRDEFLAMRITAIRPQEDFERLQASLTRERPILDDSGLWRHRLKNGEIIDVQITSHLMMWNGLSAALVVAQDITERKHAEEALRHSEERYRLLFERNLAGVFQAREDGRMTDCNEACAQILGYASRQELLSVQMADLIPDPVVAAAVGSRLADQKALTDFEVLLKGNHDKAVWVIANVSLVQNSVTHYEGTFIDITARKQAQEALKHRTLELERSNAELEQFAYISSHDLQEPLRMVASFTQLLAVRYQGRLDREADEFIDFAVEGATRMQALINGLLSFARVKSRAKDLEPTDSEAMLGRSLVSLRAALEETKARVTRDSLPIVLADDLQLEQLFQNLVGNALKFRGPHPPQVHVSARRNGAEWIFAVEDNGIGIDPGYYERIFIIFQRLHTRTAYSGTGIGLAICKRIVERHGGRIWVESIEGQGSTFYFTLPIPVESAPGGPVQVSNQEPEPKAELLSMPV